MGPLTLPTGGSVYIDANAIIYSGEGLPVVVVNDLVEQESEA